MHCRGLWREGGGLGLALIVSMVDIGVLCLCFLTDGVCFFFLNDFPKPASRPFPRNKNGLILEYLLRTYQECPPCEQFPSYPVA